MVLNKIFKKKKKIDHHNLLKEFLMTNFLIITVYEAIGKPLANYGVDKLFIKVNSHSFIPFENGAKYFFSTIPGADKNLLITIVALGITGLFLSALFKISYFLYKTKKVNEYMNSGERKTFFTGDFGAQLLLTFMITGLIILIIYPIFGMTLLILTIIAISKESEKSK